MKKDTKESRSHSKQTTASSPASVLCISATAAAEAAVALHKPLLSRRQLAQLLNLHPKTLERWEKANRIHALRLNRRVLRYDPTEIQRLLSEAR
jgi:hypothetical protein